MKTIKNRPYFQAFFGDKKASTNIGESWFSFSGKIDDARAIEAWILEHNGLIWSVVNKYAPFCEGYDQDDLYQEACIIVMSAFGEYDDRWAEVKRTTYLTTCVTNRMREILRYKTAKKRGYEAVESMEEYLSGLRNQRRETAALDGRMLDDTIFDLMTSIGGHYSFEEEVFDRDGFNRIMAFINNMKPALRDVVLLCSVGYTQMEIAAKLDIAQSTVSFRLSSARKLINDFIKEVA